MRNYKCGNHPEIRDFGQQPFVFDINHAATMNNNYRTALWTGRKMQLTLMSIPVGGDIGLEMHSDVDQFIKIESCFAKVFMGKRRDDLKFVCCADSNFAVIVPTGTWHNVVNAGQTPLKVFSLYAPPNHPFGTLQATKADAEKYE